MNRKDRKLLVELAKAREKSDGEDRRIERQELELREKEIDLQEERLGFEKDTKDRIDISKKEYLELLKIKEECERKREFIERVFYPVAERDELVYKKLCAGEIEETRIGVHPDFESTKYSAYVTFVIRFDMIEARGLKRR